MFYLIQLVLSTSILSILLSVSCQSPCLLFCHLIHYLLILSVIHYIIKIIKLFSFPGFVVSCLCDTERTATYLALGSFLPMVMMCGIIWPVEGMHFILRAISYVLPLTKSTESLRSMLQRGWTIDVPTVYSGFVSTGAWIVVYLTASILLIKFRKG